MGQIDRRFAALRVRPFRIGEAGLADCGGRVDGIGDSQVLGNDPVSALVAVAVAAIAFSVLASASSSWRTSSARVARDPRDVLAARVGGTGQEIG